jgi:antitoxin component YwqK of YwqJK toxin-antitoxin module
MGNNTVVAGITTYVDENVLVVDNSEVVKMAKEFETIKFTTATYSKGKANEEIKYSVAPDLYEYIREVANTGKVPSEIAFMNLGILQELVKRYNNGQLEIYENYKDSSNVEIER